MAILLFRGSALVKIVCYFNISHINNLYISGETSTLILRMTTWRYCCLEEVLS
jgi:hypothetical protein